MRRLIVLFLLAASARAQTALWIDLSGEWRMSADDRPEYAQPDFDDSGWKTVRLPWSKFLREALIGCGGR